MPITGLELSEIDKIQKELYDMARTIPFDDRMNHEAEIRDLKLPLIQNYLYEIKSDLLKESENMDFIDLCKSMRIVNGTPEYMKLLNVGLMFFNDEPQKFFPYSQIHDKPLDERFNKSNHICVSCYVINYTPISISNYRRSLIYEFKRFKTRNR